MMNLGKFMTQKLKFQEGKVTTKQVSVLARRARENGRTPDKLYSEILQI